MYYPGVKILTFWRRVFEYGAISTNERKLNKDALIYMKY